MTDETDRQVAKALEEQNRLLRAILALLTDIRVDPGANYAESKYGSIDNLLSEAGGLRNVEIAQLLGKTPQAVGQVIAKKGRSRGD